MLTAIYSFLVNPIAGFKAKIVVKFQLQSMSATVTQIKMLYSALKKCLDTTAIEYNGSSVQTLF